MGSAAARSSWDSIGIIGSLFTAEVRLNPNDAYSLAAPCVRRYRLIQCSDVLCFPGGKAGPLPIVRIIMAICPFSEV